MKVADYLRRRGESHCRNDHTLARFETKHDLLQRAVDTMSTDVKTLSTEGCAKGQEHSRRLDAVEGRPERLLSVTAVLVSILTGVAVLVAWIKGGGAS